MSNTLQGAVPGAPNTFLASSFSVTFVNSVEVPAQFVQRVMFATPSLDGGVADTSAENPLPALATFLGPTEVTPGFPPTVSTPRLPVSRHNGLPTRNVRDWLRLDGGESVAQFVQRAHDAGCTTLRVYVSQILGSEIQPQNALNQILVLNNTFFPPVQIATYTPIAELTTTPAYVYDLVLDPATQNIQAAGFAANMDFAAY